MTLTPSFRRDFVIAAAGLTLLLAVGLFVDHPWPRDFLTAVFAYGLLAMSLNLLIGYTGLISFGHAAFFAFGGYCFGLLLQSDAFVAGMGGASIPVALVLAIAGTALYSLVIGAICVRLSEIYFAFLTLAFQMFLYSLIISWVDLTGGDQGLMGGIPRPVFLGIDLSDQIHRYVFCAALFVACLIFLRVVTESSFGYTLRMIRDNPQRAAFLGINVFRVKLVCFVIAGSVAGVGGIILALFTSGAYPEWAFWAQSGEAIFMIMLGGLTVFLGPLVGAIALILLNDLVQLYTSHTELVTGLVILAVVLGLRKGILDFLKDDIVEPYLERRRGKDRTASTETRALGDEAET